MFAISVIRLNASCSKKLTPRLPDSFEAFCSTAILDWRSAVCETLLHLSGQRKQFVKLRLSQEIVTFA